MFLCRNKKNYPRIITKYSSLIPLVPLLQFLFVCMPVKCENVLYCLVLVCSSSLLLVLGERYALRFWSISCNFIYTIFDLINPTYSYKHTVKPFRSNQITASVLFVYFFIKAYLVGTHLNCIDLKSMQFKCVPATYAFMKKIRKKNHIIIK